MASSVSIGSATEGVARPPRSASPAAVPVSTLGHDAYRVWVSPETQHLLNLESSLDALTLFADFDIVEATTSRHNHDNLIKICMFFADQSHVDRVVEWVVAHRGAEHQRHIAAGCEHPVCIPKRYKQHSMVRVSHCVDDYAPHRPNHAAFAAPANTTAPPGLLYLPSIPIIATDMSSLETWY